MNISRRSKVKSSISYLHIYSNDLFQGLIETLKIVDKESAASDFFCDVDEMEGSADFPDNTDDDNSEDDYEYPVSGKAYFFSIFPKF